MEVKIKDRKKGVEYLRLALNMCELWVNYQQTDLIVHVLEALDRIGVEKFSLNDGVDVHHAWQERWEKYFEEQTKTEKDEKEKTE